MSAPEPIAWREVASLTPSVNPAKPGDTDRIAESGTSAPADASFALFGDDGFSFFDLVDIINPLQHIPIVSSIYRRLTGDELDAAPRVLGGALFGGAIGAALALVNVVVDEATGSDIGEHALAFLDDERGDGAIVAAAPEEADFETAAGADDALPWRKEKDLGNAMPWLAADNTGGEIAIGTPDTRTGPWAVQAFEDPRAFPGTAGSGPASRPEPQTAPAGSVAAEGGWFADVMLAALQSYERGAALSRAPQASAGGVTR